MIEKMKKLTFLVTNREKQAFIEQLRSLGVVHVVELRSDMMSEELQQSMALDARFKQAIQILADTLSQSKEKASVSLPAKADAKKGLELLDYVFSLKEQETNLRQKINELAQAIKRLSPFGNFTVKDITRLEQDANMKIDFFRCDAKQFNTNWETQFYATAISRDKANIWFVTFADQTPEIPAEHIILPEHDLAFYIQEKDSKEVELAKVEAEMLKLASVEIESIKAAQARNLGDISLSRVQMSSEELLEGAVHLMEGWVPEENADNVRTSLEKTGICYEMTSPAEDDNVPIKLRNNRFSRIYEVITKMYGFPSYQEWDPTLIVAPFFTLFFAICMGDAGYGLLILLYGLLESYGKAKNTPILGEMLAGCGPIITILGAATFVIGCCLGTFFGMNIVEIGWIPTTSAIGRIIVWLNGTIPGTTYSIQMAAALVIGTFHICLAMIVKAALYSKRYGFKSQISVWSWVLLIVGGIITLLLGMTNTLSEQGTKVAIITIAGISVAGIFLFNDLKRNPLINVGAGLYDTYNMVTGLLGDLLSYLRLYALCLAGGMLGAAFNMMGKMVLDLGDTLPSSFVPLLWIFAIVIFVFGHVFNVLMSSISAFVHPLRLIFVEYFKNSGYEGQGIEYKPFTQVQ